MVDHREDRRFPGVIGPLGEQVRERDCCDRHRRREEGIEPVGDEELVHAVSQEGPRPLREEVVRRRDELTHLQGAASGGVVVARALTQQAAVEGARLGGHDRHQDLGRPAQLWQLHVDNRRTHSGEASR